MNDGWVKIQLGEVFALDNARLGSSGDEPVVFSLSKYDGVVLANDYFGKRIASADLDGYKVLRPEHWAYSTIHIDEGSIARNNRDYSGVLSPMYTTMGWIADQHDPRFFELLLRSPHLLELYRKNARGTVNRRRSLPYSVFASIAVDVPEVAEQRRIVEVVESIDVTISAANNEQLRASQVLQALREQLILQAGYPSLPLGRLLLAIESGRSPITDGRPPKAGEPAVLKLSAIRTGAFNPAEAKALPPGFVMPPGSAVSIGDVLITRSNTPSTVGDVCFVEDVPPGIYMSDLILRLRPDPTQIAAGYLANALLTTDARRQISESARGTSGSMRKISRELIRTYTIPCPDLSIQESVLKSLESAAKVQAACAALSRTLLGVRKVVAAELLTGAHRIPETYDESLGEAV